MGTLSDRRRAMSGRSNIIYKLYNHICDGTAATAINTGIYLFNTTTYPNGWTLTASILTTQRVNLGAMVRCRSSVSPYNGFGVRYGSSVNNLNCQVNGASADLAFSVGDTIRVEIDYTPSTFICSLTIRNVTKNTSNSTSQSMKNKAVNVSLLVGGENNSDSGTFAWKSGRFGPCYINSLVVTSK